MNIKPKKSYKIVFRVVAKNSKEALASKYGEVVSLELEGDVEETNRRMGF